MSDKERDWVMKFLMGLHDSYKDIKAQILLIKPFPSLNEVYSIIQQEEKRRQIYVETPTSETMALAAQHGKDMGRQSGFSQRKYYCTHCKMARHSIERCFKANPNKLTSTHCQIHGHAVEKCFEIHGYPPRHKFHGKNRKSGDSNNQATALLSSRQEQISDNSQVSLTQEQYAQLMALLKP